jgi:signal transduction histidine kinase
MIEEDLEDYFVSPDANPEVRQNLELIQTRVVRMNQLTQGIMDYAKVEVHAGKNGELELQKMLADLTLDLGLSEEQLLLTGDVAAINVDTVNFRRVLENLIGNAVKYHDGSNDLQIIVSATLDAGRCQLSVKDNGPGIDSKFHERIFKVFQTLRTANMPESTGIGLAIVKKSVERQGGQVKILSELGYGSTFLFDWPINLVDAAAETSKEAA